MLAAQPNLAPDLAQRLCPEQALQDFAVPVQAEWLPELKRMVGVVSHHFGRNMRAIGCAGEVQLYCGCDAGFDACNNFDKCATHCAP